MKTVLLLKATLQQVCYRLASALSKARYEKFEGVWFRDMGDQVTEQERGITRVDRLWRCGACGKSTISPGVHAWRRHVRDSLE